MIIAVFLVIMELCKGGLDPLMLLPFLGFLYPFLLSREAELLAQIQQLNKKAE